MYGSKLLTSGEIKHVTTKRHQNLYIINYEGMAYFCKKSVCDLVNKPENLKALVNSYVRTAHDSSITIKRADAYHAVNTSVMAIFANFSQKVTQLSFVKASTLLDAFKASKDAKCAALTDEITKIAMDMHSLNNDIDPRIARLERSEAKHEIAERQSAAHIAELQQKYAHARNRLAESKRDYDELVLENVRLRNILDDRPLMIHGALPENDDAKDQIVKTLSPIANDFKKTQNDYKTAWNDNPDGGLPFHKSPFTKELPKKTFVERIKAIFAK